jgi:hypothetical protein
VNLGLRVCGNFYDIVGDDFFFYFFSPELAWWIRDCYPEMCWVLASARLNGVLMLFVGGRPFLDGIDLV